MHGYSFVSSMTGQPIHNGAIRIISLKTCQWHSSVVTVLRHGRRIASRAGKAQIVSVEKYPAVRYELDLGCYVGLQHVPNRQHTYNLKILQFTEKR